MISTPVKVSHRIEGVYVCDSSQEYVKKERTVGSFVQSKLLPGLHTSSQKKEVFLNG